MQFGTRQDAGQAGYGDAKVGYSAFFDAPPEGRRSRQRDRASSVHAAAGSLEDMQFAGFWVRLVAAFVDHIVVSTLMVALPLALAVIVAALLLRMSDMPLTDIRALADRYDWLSRGVATLAAAGIVAAFLRSGWQATPGKRLCSIHVVSADGGPLGYWHGFGRAIATYINILPCYIAIEMVRDGGDRLWLLLGLASLVGAVLTVALTRQKTALHDIIAATRVVHGRL